MGQWFNVQRPELDEEHDHLASIYDGRVWELENVADARLAVGGSFYNEWHGIDDLMTIRNQVSGVKWIITSYDA